MNLLESFFTAGLVSQPLAGKGSPGEESISTTLSQDQQHPPFESALSQILVKDKGSSKASSSHGTDSPFAKQELPSNEENFSPAEDDQEVSSDVFGFDKKLKTNVLQNPESLPGGDGTSSALYSAVPTSSSVLNPEKSSFKPLQESGSGYIPESEAALPETEPTPSASEDNRSHIQPVFPYRSLPPEIPYLPSDGFVVIPPKESSRTDESVTREDPAYSDEGDPVKPLQPDGTSLPKVIQQESGLVHSDDPTSNETIASSDSKTVPFIDFPSSGKVDTNDRSLSTLEVGQNSLPEEAKQFQTDLSGTNKPSVTLASQVTGETVTLPQVPLSPASAPALPAGLQVPDRPDNRVPLAQSSAPIPASGETTPDPRIVISQITGEPVTLPQVSALPPAASAPAIPDGLQVPSKPSPTVSAAPLPAGSLPVPAAEATSNPVSPEESAVRGTVVSPLTGEARALPQLTPLPSDPIPALPPKAAIPNNPAGKPIEAGESTPSKPSAGSKAASAASPAGSPVLPMIQPVVTPVASSTSGLPVPSGLNDNPESRSLPIAKPAQIMPQLSAEAERAQKTETESANRIEKTFPVQMLRGQSMKVVFARIADVQNQMAREQLSKVHLRFEFSRGQTVRLILNLQGNFLKTSLFTDSDSLRQAFRDGWDNFVRLMATRGIETGDLSFAGDRENPGESSAERREAESALPSFMRRRLGKSGVVNSAEEPSPNNERRLPFGRRLNRVA